MPTVRNIPDGDHWAILRNVSTHVPGDERSRTAPGHGYPAHTVDSIDYEAFTDKESLLDRVRQLSDRREVFKVIQVTPMAVTVDVSVDIK